MLPSRFRIFAEAISMYEVQLELTIPILWTKFAQKGSFQSKTKKVNITVESCLFELVEVPNFSLNRQFWFFGLILPKKGISDQKKKKKVEQHHWILHIRLSLGIKFPLKLPTLIFRTKFTPKRYFQLKTKNVNKSFEFYIFELD